MHGCTYLRLMMLYVALLHKTESKAYSASAVKAYYQIKFNLVCMCSAHLNKNESSVLALSIQTRRDKNPIRWFGMIE